MVRADYPRNRARGCQLPGGASLALRANLRRRPCRRRREAVDQRRLALPDSGGRPRRWRYLGGEPVDQQSGITAPTAGVPAGPWQLEALVRDPHAVHRAGHRHRQWTMHVAIVHHVRPGEQVGGHTAPGRG